MKTCKNDQEFLDREVPNSWQVLAAGVWLTLAVVVVLNDRDREQQIERRNRLGYVTVDSELSGCELAALKPPPPTLPPPPKPEPSLPPKDEQKQEMSPRSSGATISPAERAKEEKRQKLLKESMLTRCVAETYGSFDLVVWFVPCWLLFGVCGVLMLFGEIQRGVGYALGGWTFWIWACQVTIFDPPGWT
jgi:hypothetical protein